MSEPVLPDWLPIPYPIAEDVLIDLLEPIWGIGKVVTYFPENAPDGTIWVQRIGGGADEGDVTDYPLMRVSCYHDTRNLAIKLANDVQRVILGHRNRATPSGFVIDYASLDVGGSIDPDLDPDDRRVTANYTLGFRRQHHLVGQ
jgi:hypothetical protein